MASTYLTYTQQSPSTAEGQKFTLSMWVKKSANEERQGLYGNTYDNTHRAYIYFDVSDRLSYYDSGGVNYITNRLFRDNNAFYHIVVSVDTTLSTSSDRVKIYVNGVRETSFAASSAPNQNDTLKIMNTTNTPYMGRYLEAGTSRYLQGVISHAHLTQGYTYDATPFGETDATTGEWKIKTSPSVTYGTNGFFILKDGNSVTDQSGNSNNWTVGGGTLTDLKDNPDNVFATLNAIDKNNVVVLANGNTTSHSSDNTTWSAANRTTLGIASGKFYWEMKITGSGTANGLFFGVCSETVRLITNQGIQDSSTEKAKGVLVFCDDGQYQLDTNSRTSMTSAPAFNDILGCAVDRDNNTVKFYKNGSEVGSIDISSSPLATCSHIMPLMINFYTNTKFNFNFGNGLFGTTAITTNTGNGYAGAEGKSKFNYQPPTGYSALSTRGLNE